MIGFIRGIILEKQPPQLLIEVQGIGYEIDMPMSTAHQLPDVGREVRLFTHFVVREDAQLLYGFHHKEERTLFRALLKVNGVGPKLALSILSSVPPQDFVRCILNNDRASLIAVPGVGNKTAERLMIEMRDKLTDWYETSENAINHKSDNQRHFILQEAIAALISLGYKQHEANRMISKIDDGLFTSADLIRRALKESA